MKKTIIRVKTYSWFLWLDLSANNKTYIGVYKPLRKYSEYIPTEKLDKHEKWLYFFIPTYLFKYGLYVDKYVFW